MEKKTMTILLLAVLAVAIVAVVGVGEAYAMGKSATQNAVSHGTGNYGSGMGPSMMGDRDGFMGGMMGSYDGTYSCPGYMQGHPWNSTL